MKTQSIRSKRRCRNFTWRDDDPTWRAERKNDRIVFKKIRRETARGRSADKVIAALSRLCHFDFQKSRFRSMATGLQHLLSS